MARPEILDRTSVEVLLDDSRADVRGARDRGRVSEPLGHPSHDARHRLLLRRHAVRRPAELRERDRRLERPAPGPEILRREFLAHVTLDVLVELPARQVAKLAVELVAKELPPAGNTEQLRDPGGDLGVDDRGSHVRPVLRTKAKGNSLATYADVAFRQRREPVRVRSARVSLRSDAKPREVDQPDRGRRHAVGMERIERHVLAHRDTKLGQPLRESNELVVLRLLLTGAKLRVVEILASTRFVDPGRLEICPWSWRDPDVTPGGRNDERFDSRELLRIGDRVSARVDVAETPLRSHSTPTPLASHGRRV